MTPEGKVKREIKKVLDKYKGRIHYYMPVPGGYGKPSLDYLGCFYSLFFSVEAKASGKVPSPRQDLVIDEQRSAGGKTFVIDGDTTEFELWLEAVERERGDETIGVGDGGRRRADRATG